MTQLLLIIASACWGSFLNVVAYRLVTQKSLLKPCSECPECKHPLVWYDTIPILSWFLLRGKCRACHKKISWLYPLIELLSAIIFPLLWSRVSSHYFIPYFIFCSALIITIRTDLEFMLISRYVTVFLIPVGLLFSYIGLLPITPVESMLGALLGYFFLYFIAKLFFYFTGKEGMGQGDFDLLSFIGSFIGPFGGWITLLIGSTVGSVIGLLCIVVLRKHPSFKLPFGPFLAAGALAFVLFEPSLSLLFLN